MGCRQNVHQYCNWIYIYSIYITGLSYINVYHSSIAIVGGFALYIIIYYIIINNYYGCNKVHLLQHLFIIDQDSDRLIEIV